MPKAPKKRRKSRKGGDSRPRLTSPWGVAMLAIAAAFDFIPPLIVAPLNLFAGGAGELVSYPLDIAATGILGTLMWIKGGRMPFRKKAGRFVKKRGLLFAAEYTPLGFLPLHLLNVWIFLKK